MGDRCVGTLITSVLQSCTNKKKNAFKQTLNFLEGVCETLFENSSQVNLKVKKWNNVPLGKEWV